jgi:hypothetical protein
MNWGNCLNLFFPNDGQKLLLVIDQECTEEEKDIIIDEYFLGGLRFEFYNGDCGCLFIEDKEWKKIQCITLYETDYYFGKSVGVCIFRENNLKDLLKLFLKRKGNA